MNSDNKIEDLKNLMNDLLMHIKMILQKLGTRISIVKHLWAEVGFAANNTSDVNERMADTKKHTMMILMMESIGS